MITHQEFDEFVKHYCWMILKYPDYRVGQAFINYFPAFRRDIDISANLFYNTDNAQCWEIIRKYIE